MANVIITSPAEYYPNPDIDRPLFSGSMFIGDPDTDPTIVANQKQVQALQENGSFVNVSQPIAISSGGVPVDGSGNPYIRLVVDGNYSQLVKDKNGSQKYYIPNTFTGAPLTSTSDDVVLSADTVADLKTKDLQSGQIISTKGYYIAGDGGGASYLIQTAVEFGGAPDEFGDHTLANGNVAVLQIDGSINLKQYGAVGDGIANDSPAILAALTKKPDIYAPNGDYLLGTEIVFSTDSISIICEDPNDTMFTYNGTGIGMDISAVTNLLQTGRMNFKNLFIVNTVNTGTDYVSYTGQGLKLTNFHGSDVSNLKLQNFNTGIELDACYLNTFIGLTTVSCYKGLLGTNSPNSNTFIGGGHLVSSFDFSAGGVSNVFIGIDIEPGSTTSFLGIRNKMISPRFERVSLVVPINPWLEIDSFCRVEDINTAFDGSSIQADGSFMVSVTGKQNTITTFSPYAHRNGYFFAGGSRENKLVIQGGFNDGVNSGNPTQFDASRNWIVDYGISNEITLSGSNAETETRGSESRQIKGDCPNGCGADISSYFLTNITTARPSGVTPPFGLSTRDLGFVEATLTDTSGTIDTGGLFTGSGGITYSGEVYVYFPSVGGASKATLRLVANKGEASINNVTPGRWHRLYMVGIPLNGEAVRMLLTINGQIGDTIFVACPRVGPGYASSFSTYGTTRTEGIAHGEIYGEYLSEWSSTAGTQPALGNGTLVSSYYKNGSEVAAQLKMTLGAGSTIGTGLTYEFSLPYSTIGNIYNGSSVFFDSTAVSTSVGTVSIQTTGNKDKLRIYAESGSPYFTWGSTSPTAPASGDFYEINASFVKS